MAKGKPKAQSGALDRAIEVLRDAERDAVPVLGRAHAKKSFHDWLDRMRPWADVNANIYDVMERIVAEASRCFTGERIVRPADIDELRRQISVLTEGLDKHPEGIPNDWGHCRCDECMTE